MIYFLVSDDGRRCKIGYSTNLPSRVNDLRASADWEFYAAITGSQDQEGQLHRHFDHLRYKDRKEMFHLEGELRDYVEWLGSRAYAACSLDEADITACYPFPGRFPWQNQVVPVAQQSLEIFDQIVPGLRKPRSYSQRVLATIRSDSDEWYTPSIYIEAARRVMGGIDLDPASSALANLTVKADNIYTSTENGLRYSWDGRVWLNPPYGNDKDKFVEHLLAEYEAGRIEQAIMCLNAHATDTVWFQSLWRFPICLTHHRVRFLGGKKGTSPEEGAPTTGTAFVYVGPDEELFAKEFRRFGPIVRCVEWPDMTGEEFRRLQASGQDWEENAS